MGRPIQVRSRTLVIGILVILVAAGGCFAWLLFQGSQDTGAVEFAAHPADATSTVSYAGAFPSSDDTGLANPLGIAVAGDTLYVAEADAGVVRVFGLDGEDRGAILVPITGAAGIAYPSGVAVLDDDRIVVADISGARVVVLSSDPGASEPLLDVVASTETSPALSQPTAVAVEGDLILVGDPGAVHVYDTTGAFVRTLGLDMPLPLSFAGGIAVRDGVAYVTDPNRGRIAAFDIATGKVLPFLQEVLDLPRGVVTVRKDVLVVDRFASEIVVFGSDGFAFQRFGSRENEVPGAGSEALLSMPQDAVWVDDVERLYVTDPGTGRVRVYNLHGLTAE